MAEERTPDERADELAAEQHGAISRRQALEVGLTRHQIAARLASGRWRRAARGVFVVAAAPASWRRGVAVACLAGPEGTVASGLTAAALLDLVTPPDVPHLTVPPGSSGRRSGVVLHRPRRPLDHEDLATITGIPSTSAARTIVDCAALLDYESFCDLLDTALIRRLTTPRDVRDAAGRATRAPGRKGLPFIDRALVVWSTGRRPDSPPEMKLVRLMLKWGFPAPERQHPIFDHRGRFVAKVDLAVPGWRVVLEYDGQEFHGPRRKPLDAARQALIEALGWTVLRVTKHDLRPADRLRSRLQRFADARAA